ncbi:MAG: MFS transporter [Candidatus Acidiferrales bacterium]
MPDPLSIIVSALRFNDPHTDSLDAFTGGHWRYVLARWDLQRLTLPLRLTRAESVPEWARAHIDRNLADNARRFERIKQVYTRVAREAADAGAEHVVLKGFSHGPGFVEHPRLRYQSDIDLFCPPESLLLMRLALMRLGYRTEEPKHRLPQDHIAPMVPPGSWQWSGNAYDPNMPVGFELHFRLWNQQHTRLAPAGLEDFWSRRRQRPLDDVTYSGLCDVDTIGYAAIHLLRDLLSGVPDSAKIYEIARFLHRSADDHDFWGRWRECHDPSLRRLEAVAFRLATTWFANSLAPQVQEEIERLPAMVNNWFELRADAPLLRRPPLYKDNVWLHIALLSSAQDKCAIFFRALAPKLPPVEADYVQGAGLKPGEAPPASWRKYTKYCCYATSRAISWAEVIPPTLGRGVKLAASAPGLDRQFWTFFSASFCFDFGMMIYFFFYNLFLLDRGFHENVLGLVTSAMAAGSLAGAIPAGFLARRIGLRNSLLTCFSLTTLVSVARALVNSEQALLALAFAAGAVMTIWAVAISPAIAQLTSEKNRSLGFSVIFSSGIGLGVVAGQFCGHWPQWLAHLRPGIAGVHAKQIGLLLGCTITAIGILPLSRLRFRTLPPAAAKFYPRNAFMYRFLLAIATWSLLTGAIPPFASAYFSRHMGMSVARIGSVFSASQFAQVIAILAAPVIFRRLGTVTGIACTQIAAAIALLGLAHTQGPEPAMLAYVFFSGFLWMSEPGMYSLLMSQVKPEEQTGASTMNFLVIGLAQMIAAAAAGAAFARFGYSAVLGAAAILALLSAILFQLLLGKTLSEMATSQVPGTFSPVDRANEISEPSTGRA